MLRILSRPMVRVVPFFFFFACVTSPPDSPRISRGAEAKNMAVVNIGLPALSQNSDSSGFKNYVDGYRLQISDDTCENSVISNDVANYVNGFVSINVKRNCSYHLSLALGLKDKQNQNTLRTVYYSSTKPYQLNANVLGDVPTNITIPVELTQDGRMAGLPALSTIGGATPMPGPTTNPNPNPKPNPTIAPPPPTNLAPIFSQISLTDGQQRPSTLADQFKGQYLLIDFSASSCGNCVDFADTLEKDSQFQSIIQQGKCSAVTLVSRSDYRDWISLIQSNGIRDSGHTFAATAGIFEVGDKFKIDVSGIPAVGIVDTSGKTVSSGNQEQLDRFKQLCR